MQPRSQACLSGCLVPGLSHRAIELESGPRGVVPDTVHAGAMAACGSASVALWCHTPVALSVTAGGPGTASGAGGPDEVPTQSLWAQSSYGRAAWACSGASSCWLLNHDACPACCMFGASGAPNCKLGDWNCDVVLLCMPSLRRPHRLLLRALLAPAADIVCNPCGGALAALSGAASCCPALAMPPGRACCAPDLQPYGMSSASKCALCPLIAFQPWPPCVPGAAGS